MMRGARTRRPFDPAGDFIAKRAMELAGGRRIAAGEPFPKGAVDARRLHIFYNARFIAYAEETARDRWLPPSRAVPAPRLVVSETPAPDDPLAIPSDWRTMPWPQMLALASQFSKARILGKLDALDAIETELLRRGQAIAA
jgi:hypothetical protein